MTSIRGLCTASIVKPLVYLQLLLQALDLHSTLSQLSTRTEMNQAVRALGVLIGIEESVVIMKAVSVLAILLLFRQWKAMPKPSPFDVPLVIVIGLLDLTLIAVLINNYCP